MPEDIERPAEILWRKEKLFEKISKEPNGSTVGIVGHSMFFLDLTGDFLENCGFKQYTLDFLMNR